MTTRTPGDAARHRRSCGRARSRGNARLALLAFRSAEGLRRLAVRLDRAAAHAAGRPAVREAVRGTARSARAAPARDPQQSAPDRQTEAPHDAIEAPHEPVTEAPPGTPSGAGPDAPAATSDCVAVARDVLAVADRLRNEELARRLFDAVGRLPGLGTVRPSPGDPFDPATHRWEETRPTDDPAREDTVAALLAPGFTGPENALIRTAKVAVYAAEEE
ncbi:hypothetical protein [Streptomyces sp. HNA39]|uniref:hypothetical protein n=1 Tax=Streptomyces sp. HNA39 TaxID=2850561 RepID=UPI00200FA0D5|nr:hypothetical protein [Streptomyces sp. HNA39]UQA32351.1 hypothetical protein KRR37_00225 [Streptomyces sp. HNA39]